MPFEKLLLIIIRHKNFNPQNSSPGNKPNVSTADHHCLNLLLHSDQAVQGHDRKSTNSFIMMKSDEKRSPLVWYERIPVDQQPRAAGLGLESGK
ncbi:hypothetical protein RRG08_037814 [Elysia crispata]|uniref:Uncharacterized protein n=1 Tax=Elysia crispata TaxID=231223 RepID=A0AAE1BDF3_9GAST|nr:hypothetical protein RRG08_037814 [Elysia crispata]